MRTNKKIYVLIILIMIIGFATVATTLYLNGTAFIAGNDAFDGDVIFTEAKNENGKNFQISADGKTITYTSKELASINDLDKLLFKVTNNSTQYGANVTIDCATNEGEDNTLVIFGSFFKGETLDTHETVIDRQETKDGYLNVTLIKNVTEAIDVEFTCTINATPIEKEGKIESDPLANLNSYKMVALYSVEELDNYSEYDIKFINSSSPIENALATMNLGLTDEDDVTGYITNKVDGNGYLLNILSPGKIVPYDLSGMFIGKTLTNDSGLQYLDTSTITGMDQTFQYATLNNVDLSSWDLSSVTQMNAAFQEAKLTNVNMDNWNLSTAYGVSNLFYQAQLSNVSMDNWSIPRAYNFDNMFYQAQIDDLTIDFKNTSAVTTAQAMFSGLRGNNLTIANFDTSNLSYMSGMFRDINLNSLTLTDLNTSNVININNVFNNATINSDLDLSNLEVDKVEYLGGAFYKLKAKNLNLSGWQLNNVNYYPGIKTDFLGYAEVDDFIAKNMHIDNLEYLSGIFSGFTKVNKIDLTNFSALKATNVTSLIGQSPAKTVILKNANLPEALYFNYMFSSESELTSVDFSGVNAPKVYNFMYMFDGCTNLTKLDLTSIIPGNEHIGSDYMFKDTPNLTEVKVSTNWTQSLESTAFSGSGTDHLTYV